MIIAISATGNGWKEALDERFGRAKGFFLIDNESGQTHFLDNGVNTEAAHGAGTAAVQMLVNAGVGVLLTGRVGPKAGDALKAAGVTVVEIGAECTVEEAWANNKKSLPK